MDSRKASLFICRTGWLPVNSPPDKGSKIALPTRLQVNVKINIAFLTS